MYGGGREQDAGGRREGASALVGSEVGDGVGCLPEEVLWAGDPVEVCVGDGAVVAYVDGRGGVLEVEVAGGGRVEERVGSDVAVGPGGVVAVGRWDGGEGGVEDVVVVPDGGIGGGVGGGEAVDGGIGGGADDDVVDENWRDGRGEEGDLGADVGEGDGLEGGVAVEGVACDGGGCGGFVEADAGGSVVVDEVVVDVELA